VTFDELPADQQELVSRYLAAWLTYIDPAVPMNHESGVRAAQVFAQMSEQAQLVARKIKWERRAILTLAKGVDSLTYEELLPEEQDRLDRALSLATEYHADVGDLSSVSAEWHACWRLMSEEERTIYSHLWRARLIAQGGDMTYEELPDDRKQIVDEFVAELWVYWSLPFGDPRERLAFRRWVAAHSLMTEEERTIGAHILQTRRAARDPLE
jgi:hypothetical protein